MPSRADLNAHAVAGTSAQAHLADWEKAVGSLLDVGAHSPLLRFHAIASGLARIIQPPDPVFEWPAHALPVRRKTAKFLTLSGVL
jgi:hypothetical protein